MGVRKVKTGGRARWLVNVCVTAPDGRKLRRREKHDRFDEAKAAEAKLREELRQQASGEGGASREPAPIPTVEGFRDEFLAHQDAINRASERAQKRQILRMHIVPAFGHLRLDQVTTRLVDQYKAAKLATLAPNTVATHVTLIKKMLNVAREWNILERVPKITQVKRPDPEVDFLSFEEAEKFLAAAGPWRSFVLVAMRTGLRLGELRGLRVQDVDLARKTIRVAKQYGKNGWEAPKSGHGRTVNLTTDAVAVLRDQIPARASRQRLVFPHPDGSPLSEKAVYLACKRISKTAKLGRTINPHKLRHTFASHHAMRGTPLAVIQAWLGHADIKTTMRYAHLCPSVTATFADNIGPQTGPRLLQPADEAPGAPTGAPTQTPNSKTAS